jgi:hypothetical protein
MGFVAVVLTMLVQAVRSATRPPVYWPRAVWN